MILIIIKHVYIYIYIYIYIYSPRIPSPSREGGSGKKNFHMGDLKMAGNWLLSVVGRILLFGFPPLGDGEFSVGSSSVCLDFAPRKSSEPEFKSRKILDPSAENSMAREVSISHDSAIRDSLRTYSDFEIASIARSDTFGPIYIYIYIYTHSTHNIYITHICTISSQFRPLHALDQPWFGSLPKVRPVHLSRVSLLRVLESNFPGDPLSNSSVLVVSDKPQKDLLS